MRLLSKHQCFAVGGFLLVLCLLRVGFWWQGIKSNSSTKNDNDDDHPSLRHHDDGVSATKEKGKVILSDPTSNENKDKPLFVIHVGPAKSGTTSFQYALQTLDKQLRQDDYIYLGNRFEVCPPEKRILKDHACFQYTNLLKEPGRMMTQSVLCMMKETKKLNNDDEERMQMTMNGTVTEECWSEYKKRLKSLVVHNISQQQRQQNVIQSEEALAKFPVHLEGIVDEWDVRIVVTYRRLWDWVFSRWNQSYKTVVGSGRIKWKSCHRSDKMPPIAEWLRSTLEDKETSQFRLWTKPVMKRYEEGDLSLPVQVMNMHNKTSPPIISFLCEILPNATTACQEALRQQEESSSRTLRNNERHDDDLANMLRNPSTPMELNYEVIACSAVRKGLLVENRDTPNPVVELFKAIRTFHQVELESEPLPLHCADNETLEQLWEETLRYEEEIVPDFFRSTDQELHRQEFLSAVSRNKFCSVNVTAILEDQKWKKFFKQHNTQTT